MTAAAAVDTAAALMLRGIDPHRHLTCRDPLEAAVTARATRRAIELRQQELQHLAGEIAARIARAFAGR